MYVCMYIYIYYTYISCLQGYRGTFKDESLMTIRDLREQRFVENSLIRSLLDCQYTFLSLSL